jgi:hypothetical protein
MTRKGDSKTNRKLVRQSKRDAEKHDARSRDVPEYLGRRNVQGVLIDETQWEWHDL